MTIRYTTLVSSDISYSASRVSKGLSVKTFSGYVPMKDLEDVVNTYTFYYLLPKDAKINCEGTLTLFRL